ncbi:MAG: hypothetical protein R2742_00590 [Micropruina glycogenica]
MRRLYLAAIAYATSAWPADCSSTAEITHARDFTGSTQLAVVHTTFSPSACWSC